MNQSIHNPDASILSISGTVCGNKEIEIKDFNKVKCPICGACMSVSGADMSHGDIEYDKYIMTERHYSDDAGTPHHRYFGRDRRQEQIDIYMSCPNRCVKEMKLGVKQITYGGYREFSEMTR